MRVRKQKILWTTGGKINVDSETKIIEYQNKRNIILELMRSVRHSVTPQWVSEELADRGIRMGAFIVNLLFTETEETGRIKQDGDSWKYPVHARIYDLFQAYPDKRFSLDSICRELVIPKLETEKIEKYLKDFETKNIIFLINGEWISTKDIDKKITILANEKIRESVLRTLDETHNISKNDTVKDRYMTSTSARQIDLDRIVVQVKEEFFKTGFLELIEKHGIEPRQAIENEISVMIAEGSIIKSDSMLSKKD